MSDIDQVQKDVAEIQVILQELIETLHDQSKELDRFAMQVEQQTDLRDYPKELAVATSKLGELRYRIRKMAGHAVRSA
jgi:hypothetical protein